MHDCFADNGLHAAQAGHYNHVGVMQCSPYGVPAFLHRINGGKPQVGKNVTEAAYLPVYTTAALSENAMGLFGWDGTIDNKILPFENAIQPDNIICQWLDYSTIVLLEEYNQTR